PAESVVRELHDVPVRANDLGQHARRAPLVTPDALATATHLAGALVRGILDLVHEIAFRIVLVTSATPLPPAFFQKLTSGAVISVGPIARLEQVTYRVGHTKLDATVAGGRGRQVTQGVVLVPRWSPQGVDHHLETIVGVPAILDRPPELPSRP